MPSASRFGSKTVPRSANARRVEDGDVGSRAFAQDAAVGQADPLGRLARQAMDGFLRGEQLLVADHEAPEPRRPRVRAVEVRLGELAVRRQRRRVGARHAEPVRERLALLVLGVRVDDHHQLLQLVDPAQQEVVGGVERLHAAVGGDRGEVAAAVLRPDLAVQQDDARPVVAGAQDRAMAAHLVALRRIAQDRRQLAPARRRAPRRAAPRRGSSARRCACACRTRRPAPRRARSRRARCSGGSPRSRCAGRDARPAAAPRRSHRCGSPRPPRRRRPRRACACASRRTAPSAPAPSAPPRSPPAPARTRARSSSPSAPSSSDSRSSTCISSSSAASAGRSARPSVASRSCPFGTRLSTLTAGRHASSVSKYSPAELQLIGRSSE